MKCVLFLYLSFFEIYFLIILSEGRGGLCVSDHFQYLMLDKPVGIRMIYGPGMDVTW